MIKKILIANRGEIALRIIRTCNEIEISTVAIYSEADEHSPHVTMADESYYVGPSHVSKSYLRIDNILEIAKRAKVDAIHPGYGLLSENSSFATECIEAGFIFIGPSPKVMKQMGDKITARQMMKQANVPVIPGNEHALLDTDEAVEVAKVIGYPLMLKASAGGGGIGLQIVRDESELESSFEKNSKRAVTLFHDGSMFLEKLIEDARHVEVQVLADTKGNAIHLFDRECSIQRRNQKVIEEAPCHFITDKTRKKMTDAAVRAVQAINYVNAGTIEFLVDKDEQFYFLEMNTRIQVEHPITEAITGVDLVKEQINIASGQKLNYKQHDITIQGHAMEARIYAEDPKTLFPSPGRIDTYQEPIGRNIRIDSSVKANMQVTPFYDPMISKLIVSATTRKETISLLQEALANYKIEGIKTNIPLLINIINNDDFQSGTITTKYLETWIKNKEEQK